jgi:hypothetical protein
MRLAGFLLLLLPTAPLPGEQPANAPLPDVHQLLREVMEHQKQLDKVRENYTYSSFQTVQDVDANGKVKKTETEESEDFFVNGHLIERNVKKNGQPLSGHDLDKETERVTKLVEKAEKTPPDQALEGQTIGARTFAGGRRSSSILWVARMRRPTGWPRTHQRSCRERSGLTSPGARWRTWR